MVCRREKILAALLRGLSRAEDEGEGKERGEAARTGGAVAECCAREGWEKWAGESNCRLWLA